ncbi:RadC family protein [uncultured Pontibacter sp.]|uniref:JAB domain-containing protein n=1 Tax=uncultured Pontibacter sp. TaxID=453356 RepID=UPI0026262E45|nr:JAB domain-containing protein [uncultured Pontibacter sp.]
MKNKKITLGQIPVSAVGEVELTYKRLHTADAIIMRNVKVTSSTDVYTFLRSKMEPHIEHIERFYAIYFNRANNVMGVYQVSSGGVAGTVADPKIILQAALLLNASSIVIAHNHPSGNTKPSSADITMTKKMKAACETMDIVLLDHLIVCEESFYSFADEGML